MRVTNDQTTIIVSVIIPVYNVADYLRECIDSVLGQTYRHIQIILIDDGSIDNSPRICDEYAMRDRRIEVIHQRNGGLSDARNAGLRKAVGQYVYFLDSDDYILPFTIEALVHQSMKDDTDFVFFDADVVGMGGLPVDHYHRKGVYVGVQDGKEVFAQLVNRREYYSAVPLLFINRTLILKYALSFFHGIIYEDELFTFILFHVSHRVTHLPLKLYKRRVREDSILTRKETPRNFLSLVCVLRETLAFTASHHIAPGKGCYQLHFDRIVYACILKYFKLSHTEQRTYRKEVAYVWEINRVIAHRSKLKNVLRLSWIPAIRAYIPTGLKRAAKYIILRNKSKRNPFTHLRQDKPTIWLLGTPEHGNLGDHAIAIAEMLLLRECCGAYQVIEIVMPDIVGHERTFQQVVSNQDIIAISGGGWLGTLWMHNEIFVRRIIADNPNNRIVILPQTVYYEGTPDGRNEIDVSRRIYGAHEYLHFCLRERASYEFVLANGFVKDSKHCYLLPDAVLTLSPKLNSFTRDGVLLCMRNDREQIMTEEQRWQMVKRLDDMGLGIRYTTTVYLRDIAVVEREGELRDKFEEYAHSKLVITDRLHSMLFALITGTPCIAFDNKTHKVSGVYHWVAPCEYVSVVNCVEQAMDMLPQILSQKPGAYDEKTSKALFIAMLEDALSDAHKGESILTHSMRERDD